MKSTAAASRAFIRPSPSDDWSLSKITRGSSRRFYWAFMPWTSFLFISPIKYSSRALLRSSSFDCPYRTGKLDSAARLLSFGCLYSPLSLTEPSWLFAIELTLQPALTLFEFPYLLSSYKTLISLNLIKESSKRGYSTSAGFWPKYYNFHWLEGLIFMFLYSQNSRTSRWRARTFCFSWIKTGGVSLLYDSSIA